LRQLETDARESPDDPDRQAAFLRELAKTYPDAVVERYESQKFASNEACTKEYMKALVALGRVDRSVLTHSQDDHSYGDYTSRGSASISSNAANSTALPVAGAAGITADKPIYVAMPEPSFKNQAWKTVRAIATLFLVMSALGAVVEERGLSKGGLSLSQEVQPSKDSVKKFDDVKGCDEAKGELEEVVAFLRDPKKFTRLGGKLPRGILLVGPPGTGKTLLARAVAGEAGVPFFYASGSEFEELFVGVGARRVRELFAAAKKKAPCIIFIDEMDAVGAKRNPKDQQYMRMTLNQLLAEMDGFNPSEGIVVLAATNFPESLDKALTRPGRFDRHVQVPVPDVEGRRQILELHLKTIPTAKDVDIKVIARGTSGFTGADLANLVNIAAIRASVEGRDVVDNTHLEFAKDRVIMGAERKSAKIDEKNRRLTAYHEGGHALVASLTADADPVHKATIVPRGSALGMVTQLPESDHLSFTKKQLLARLDVCMGGRVAEELIFGADEITAGASSDIKQATQLAQAMVMNFGMSEKMGMVTYQDDPMHGESVSPQTKRHIEEEVKRVIDEAYQRAKEKLKKHEEQLHSIAKALLEYETLSGTEVKDIINGKAIRRAS